MGVYETSYLGPYLEVTGRLVTKTRINCYQPGCPKPDTGYCPKCGMEATVRTSSYEAMSPDPDDLFSDDVLHEHLTNGCDDRTDKSAKTVTRIFVPNIQNPHEIQWGRHEHPEGAVPIDAAKIKAGLDWFEAEYASEIATMSAAPGLKVAVRWGLVRGYN